MSTLPAQQTALPSARQLLLDLPGAPDLPWWHRTGKWLRRRLGPWVGVHDQYPPRPLKIPLHYTHITPPANPPRISIVTPSYNQGRYLERTLRSVLSQRYPAVQLIVQDGGSTDETLSILMRYKHQLHHVESARDRGQAHAINLGFRHADGVILAYLNSDDLLLPGTLAYVANYFDRHPEVDVVYGHRIIINAADEEVGRWVMPPHSAASFVWNDYIPQETLFWRRRLWDKIGGRFEDTLQSALDWDVLLRFHQAGARFARLPRFLGAFRIHPQQKSDARLQDLGIPEQKRLRDVFHQRAVSRLEMWTRLVPFLGKSILFHRLYQLGLVSY
jgi:glycosyltransferase involved in cell wall biosynthesis